jgi:hypothetical protein
MAGRNNGKMKKPKMMMEGGPMQPLSPPKKRKPFRPKKPKAGMQDPMGRKMLAAGGSGKARKGFSGGGVPKPGAKKKPNGMKSGGMLKGKAGKRASGPKVVSFQDYIKKMFG